jgi:hypothetical protein
MNRTAFIFVTIAAFAGLPFAAGCSCESEPAGAVDAGEDAGEGAGEDAGWDVEPPPREDAAAETRETGYCQGRCCALPEEVAVLASGGENASLVPPLAVDSSAGLFASVGSGLGNCLDKLLVYELGSSVYRPRTSTAQDACYSIGSSIIGPGDGGWLLLWVDRRESAEVRSALYAPEGELVPAEPFQVSDSARLERELAMTRMGDSVLVAWVEEDPDTRVQAVVARQVSLAGEPLAPPHIIRESNELSFSGLDLSSLGENSAILLYRAAGADAELVMQALDSAGQEQATYQVLSGAAGEYGSAAAAFDQGVGAVVYSVSSSGASGQVRFRSLNAEGGLKQDDRPLVSSPEMGSDASIARLPTGFMVVYRAAKPGPDGEMGMIRVIFMDREGNVDGSSDVYEASLHGSRTSVRVTADLRAAISWIDYYDNRSEHNLVNLWCMQ